MRRGFQTEGYALHRVLELYAGGEGHSRLLYDALRRSGRRVWVPVGGFLWARVRLSWDMEDGCRCEDADRGG